MTVLYRGRDSAECVESVGQGHDEPEGADGVVSSMSGGHTPPPG